MFFQNPYVLRKQLRSITAIRHQIYDVLRSLFLVA